MNPKLKLRKKDEDVFMKWFRHKKNQRLLTDGRPLTSFGEVIYAVGDIHGRFDLLVNLIDLILADFEKLQTQQSFTVSARLIFLGDYIDRGSDSYKVIDFLIGLKLESFEISYLKGNHEQILIDVLDKPTVFRNWLTHGGEVTVSSYGVDIDTGLSDVELENQRKLFCQKMPQPHKDFLKSLKPYYHRPPLFFVHAGVNPKNPLDQQDEQDCLWIRESFLDSRKKLSSIIVHGHTPQTLPSWDGRRIGVDTGAYFTNILASARIYGNSVDFIST